MKTKQFLNTNIDDLSTRSQNIISRLGGIPELLVYYKKHLGFFGIEKAGKFSNDELSSFCQYLIFEEDKEYITNHLDNPNEALVRSCIFMYESEKKYLRPVSQKLLQKQEVKYKYAASQQNKFQFVINFFMNFDYKKFFKRKTKSLMEIELLQDKILKLTESKQVAIAENFNQTVSKALYKTFKIKTEEKDIELLLQDEGYAFAKLFCICFLNAKVNNHTHLKYIRYRFFTEENFDRKIFAKELNRTAERLRQLDESYRNSKATTALNLASSIIDFKSYELIDDSERNFKVLDNIPHFIFNGIEYTPNILLSKIAFKYVYKEHYELIDNLICDSFKSFIIPSNNLFVSHKFIEETKFVRLLAWLDEQIFNFESIAFDYRLDVLIKRYYQEENLNINTDQLNDLYSIITKIKRESFEIKSNTRQLKKDYVDDIIKQVHLFLMEKKKTQSTKSILSFLCEMNYDIAKHDLLRFLNKRKSTFAYFGNGNWSLKEWNLNNSVSGTFRQIVQAQLAQSKTPIHISDIYHQINLIKKVSLHSLRSNLKSDSNATFKFFNCSFIGLSDRKYDDYWNSIPQFQSYHLTNNQQNGNIKQEKAYIKQLNSKFGYPIQHLQFIIDCRKGKYNLEAINKQTELKFSND